MRYSNYEFTWPAPVGNYHDKVATLRGIEDRCYQAAAEQYPGSDKRVVLTKYIVYHRECAAALRAKGFIKQALEHEDELVYHTQELMKL